MVLYEPDGSNRIGLMEYRAPGSSRSTLLKATPRLPLRVLSDTEVSRSSFPPEIEGTWNQNRWDYGVGGAKHDIHPRLLANVAFADVSNLDGFIRMATKLDAPPVADNWPEGDMDRLSGFGARTDVDIAIPNELYAFVGEYAYQWQGGSDVVDGFFTRAVNLGRGVHRPVTYKGRMFCPKLVRGNYWYYDTVSAPVSTETIGGILTENDSGGDHTYTVSFVLPAGSGSLTASVEFKAIGVGPTTYSYSYTVKGATTTGTGTFSGQIGSIAFSSDILSGDSRAVTVTINAVAVASGTWSFSSIGSSVAAAYDGTYFWIVRGTGSVTVLRVYRYDLDGSNQQSLGTVNLSGYFRSGGSVLVASDGSNIYLFTTSNNIGYLNIFNSSFDFASRNSFTPASDSPLPTQAGGMTLLNNVLYLVTGRIVQGWNLTGGGYTLGGSGVDLNAEQSASPYGLTNDGEQFYIVDHFTGQVFIYNSSWVYQSKFSYPSSIGSIQEIVYANGRLYLFSSTNSKAHVFTTTGSYLGDADESTDILDFTVRSATLMVNVEGHWHEVDSGDANARQPRFFAVANNKLWGGDWADNAKNTLRSSTDPTVPANWSTATEALSEIGDPSSPINGLLGVDTALYIAKPDGLFGLFPDGTVSNFLPEFEQSLWHSDNGKNLNQWNGYILYPFFGRRGGLKALKGGVVLDISPANYMPDHPEYHGAVEAMHPDDDGFWVMIEDLIQTKRRHHIFKVFFRDGDFRWVPVARFTDDCNSADHGHEYEYSELRLFSDGMTRGLFIGNACPGIKDIPHFMALRGHYAGPFVHYGTDKSIIEFTQFDRNFPTEAKLLQRLVMKGSKLTSVGLDDNGDFDFHFEYSVDDAVWQRLEQTFFNMNTAEYVWPANVTGNIIALRAVVGTSKTTLAIGAGPVIEDITVVNVLQLGDKKQYEANVHIGNGILLRNGTLGQDFNKLRQLRSWKAREGSLKVELPDPISADGIRTFDVVMHPDSFEEEVVSEEYGRKPEMRVGFRLIEV